MNLRMTHRALACFVALFILLHLTNHAALFWGVEQHVRVQEILRPIYRHPVVETLLLLAFAGQMFVGLRLLFRRGWPKRNWARAQVISGALLFLFLLQHIAAVLLTRALKPEIDTNVYWAAAVVSRIEFAQYFAPYYAIGIFALFLHVASFLVTRHQRTPLAFVLLIAGSVYAIAIVTMLSGGAFEIHLPAPYEAYLDDYWF